MSFNKNYTEVHQLSGEELAKLEEELFDYDGDDKIITSHELAENIDSLPELPKYKTHMPTLDDRLNGGFEPGELVIVSAPTGHGKTTLGMTFTRSMVRNDDRNIAWISYEVTPRQFINKMRAPSDWDEVPLFYIPKDYKDGDFDWLYHRILEAKAKHNIDCVFIDNLHDVVNMESMRKGETSLEIGQITSKLKQVALRLGVTVFLSTHLRKMSSRKTEPNIGDIRDSGRIADNADIVLGLWRISDDSEGDERLWKKPDNTDTRAKIDIWKNRRGRIGYILADWEAHHYQELERYQDNYGDF